MSKRFVLLGAGKMATALGKALAQSGLLPWDEILAIDPSEAARAAFTQTTGLEALPLEQTGEALAQTEYLLLAVKPQVAEAAVAALPTLKKSPLILSICAGIPLAKLSQWLGTRRIIRIMPNTPLMVGQGASCYAPDADATESDIAFADALLGNAGLARRVTEDQMDAVTALSGSGPAYFFEMAQALALAGETVGLSPELALDLTIQTMRGSAEMLAQKLGTPDALRDAVTSPNGTTYAGLQVMKSAGFRKCMQETVQAARDRSVELGRG